MSMATYDVTAISHGDQHVPLTARTTYSTAHEIARPRSTDGDWSAVQVRESGTGRVIATYVNGQTRQQPKIRIPLPGIPENCPSCGAQATGWPLTIYGGNLNVTCPECFSIVAPVIAVRSEAA